MEKLANAIVSRQLRNPFLYALLLLLLGLFYTGKTKDAQLTLVFLVVYVIFTSLLIYITQKKINEVGVEKLETDPFVKKLELNFSLLFVILTIVYIVVNLFVFKKLILEVLPSALVLLAVGMPKNIQIASEFFLLKGIRQYSLLSIEPIADTVILEDDYVISKDIKLNYIFADWKNYATNDFDLEDKVVKLGALTTDENGDLDRAIVSAYNIDKAKLKESYKELAKPAKGKKDALYFYEIEEKNTAILRGDPESVLERCDFIEEEEKVKQLSFGNKKQLLKQVTSFASANLNVIAIAYKEFKTKKIDDKNYGFIFLAFLVFGLSPRKECNELVKSCKETDIKSIYISKEKYEVVKYLATDFGLVSSEQDVIDWNSNITDTELIEILKETPVVANANADAKQRIIQLLEKNKAIVQKGSLNNFIEKSNNTKSYFSNISNYARYYLIFAFSLFLIFLANLFLPELVPSFQLNWIVFFMLLSYFPSIAFAFGSEDLKKTKLKLNRLFYGVNVFLALFLSIIIVGFLVYVFTTYGTDAAFLAFIAMQGFSLLNSTSLKRSFISSIKSNKAILLSFLVIMVLLFTLYSYPQLQSFFGLTKIDQNDFLLVLSISFGIVIVEEIRKVIIRF